MSRQVELMQSYLPVNTIGCSVRQFVIRQTALWTTRYS